MIKIKKEKKKIPLISQNGISHRK